MKTVSHYQGIRKKINIRIIPDLQSTDRIFLLFFIFISK